MATRTTRLQRILEHFLLLFLFHIPCNNLQSLDSSNDQSVENSSLPFVNHMRCVCDGECEPIREQDCVWGLTLDSCGCCLLCSRGEGEPCGGALGTCTRGLKCSAHTGGKEATCSQPIQVESCVNPSSQFGCSFHGGNCYCENHTMCPDTEMFLFDTKQACRSRIAFLNARNERSVLTSKSHRTEDDCSRVKCPMIKNCPPDSHRLPSSIREEDSNECCPLVEKCQCNPRQLCPKPECPSGWTEELILNATGEPGNCCPLLQCNPGSGPLHDEKKVCVYEGTTYHPGDIWTHDEDCTECMCSIDGVVTCQRIKCDMPAECGLARAPPNSCCPLCVGCVTSSGKVYNNSEVWEEDDCTLCECEEGRVKCHAAMCGTQCEDPVYVPGECCPRCEGEESSPESAARTEGSVGRLRSRKQTCFIQDDKVGVVIKSEGDEWNDGCRFCICKSGMEMCTLITCRPPYCEHPVFFPGDCCPRCPDEDVIPTNPNLNVTSCPGMKSQGKLWNLTPCLQCTCHHGRTLCSHPTCPPAPCDVPKSIGSSQDNFCCSQCPPHSGGGEGEGIDEEKIGDDGRLRKEEGAVNNKNSITKSSQGRDEKRNCFSDDSHTEYSHGDTWKVSPCQSCVCEDGKIQCFSSSGNCPHLTCDQPILAKNQCCPICLDDGEKVKTEMNCTMSGSNETWAHGQSWTLDKCTHCMCNAPLVQCTRIVCSISCKAPLLYLENECCPICPNDDDDTTSDNSRFDFFGGPYCLVLIGVLIFTSSALAYYVLRYHRRRKRRMGDKSVLDSTPTDNPTIDCCYFNKEKNYEESSIARSDSCATQEKLIV